jgi:hypothetical protein
MSDHMDVVAIGQAHAQAIAYQFQCVGHHDPQRRLSFFHNPNIARTRVN